jgi:hypothetical protein
VASATVTPRSRSECSTTARCLLLGDIAAGGKGLLGMRDRVSLFRWAPRRRRATRWRIRIHAVLSCGGA